MKNLCVKDIDEQLTSPAFHAPRLATKATSVLLYENDTVLVYQTQVREDS